MWPPRAPVVAIAAAAAMLLGCGGSSTGADAFTPAQRSYLRLNNALLRNDRRAAVGQLCAGIAADKRELVLRTALRDPAFVDRGQHDQTEVVVRGIVIDPRSSAEPRPTEDEIIIQLKRVGGAWCVAGLDYESKE